MGRGPSHTAVSLDLLNQILGGHRPTFDELKAFVDSGVRENVHLDLKDGRWLTPTAEEKKKNESGKPVLWDRRLRKWTAGFANGVGGVLVVGFGEVKDADGRVIRYEPAPVKDGTAESWEADGSQAVALLRPALPGAFRCVGVEAPGGTVLVVATPRAVGLVTCIEESQTVTYFRFHDSTVHAPAYLVEDLVLRSRSRFQVEVTQLKVELQLPPGEPHPRLSVSAVLQNAGLSWMERPRMGLVALSDDQHGGRSVPAGLLQELLLVTPRNLLRHPPRLFPLQTRVNRAGAEDAGPFDEVIGNVRQEPSIMPDSGDPTFVWGAALYVVALHQPPQWIQVVAVRHSASEPLIVRHVPCFERPARVFIEKARPLFRTGWLKGAMTQQDLRVDLDAEFDPHGEALR